MGNLETRAERIAHVRPFGEFVQDVPRPMHAERVDHIADRGETDQTGIMRLAAAESGERSFKILERGQEKALRFISRRIQLLWQGGNGDLLNGLMQ